MKKGKNVFSGVFRVAIIGGLAYFLYQKFAAASDFSGRSIIIGDSHAVGIQRLLKNVEKSPCAKGGWTVKTLKSCLATQAVQPDVKKVFVSIGTNGIYSPTDDIKGLILLIQSKYPSAKIYFYQGSYGWSGNRPIEDVVKRFNAYYNKVKSYGIKVIYGLGYFATDAAAHSLNTDQARALAARINYIANGTPLPSYLDKNDIFY